MHCLCSFYEHKKIMLALILYTGLRQLSSLSDQGFYDLNNALSGFFFHVSFCAFLFFWGPSGRPRGSLSPREDEDPPAEAMVAAKNRAA